MTAATEFLFNMALPPTSVSEDCLYLSVYTPAHAHEGSSLPVSDQDPLGEGQTFLLQEDKKRQGWPGSLLSVALVRSFALSAPTSYPWWAADLWAGVPEPWLLPEVTEDGPVMDPGLTQPICGQDHPSGAQGPCWLFPSTRHGLFVLKTVLGCWLLFKWSSREDTPFFAHMEVLGGTEQDFDN